MNICLVSQEYPPETARGGIGTQTWNKARSLARLGHSVHVLSCGAGEGPDLRTEIENGITVHRMRPPGQECGEEFPVYNAPTYSLGYTWSVLRQLNKLMRITAFDVIDFAEYGAEGFGYQLKACCREEKRPDLLGKLFVGRPNIGNRERLLERISDVLSRRWLSNNGCCIQ
jgi:hypothetical protein